MSAIAVPASCPDPHQPDPVDDVRLRHLEKTLVVALVTATAGAVREGATDHNVREYVQYLHELHCPPEHVVIRVKRLLLRATRGMSDRGEASALCEAMVLRAIEIYFERR
jgi:hypothetical protein